MTPGEIKAALHNGDPVFGTCIVSNSPHWPPMVASVGLDFVFIDTEHVPIDRAQLAWMCKTYAALDLPPIVRIPEPNPYRACMALDAGAAGVIAPYLESVQQVKDLRGAVKFRPLKGQRLYDMLDGKEQLEPELADYLTTRNADKLMVVNVESIPALRALDDILAVPDIDALLVGPHDLSLNLGIPEQYRHPRFLEAISTIIRKARNRSIGVGLHYSENIDHEIEWAKEGANLIIHASDFALAQQALKADMAKFRKTFGAAPTKKEGAGPEAI